MRSEGVLRLILNINLFKGMKINLEQDKFLRIVALEDGKLVHFAIKVSQWSRNKKVVHGCSSFSSALTALLPFSSPTPPQLETSTKSSSIPFQRRTTKRTVGEKWDSAEYTV
jgi:hypothetical protein